MALAQNTGNPASIESQSQSKVTFRLLAVGKIESIGRKGPPPYLLTNIGTAIKSVNVEI